jgi:hypothetical protein
MAIAQAYPLGTPKTNDLIVGTSIPAVNTNEDPKTVNFSVGDIVNLAVTGSGTLNTIPLWTPNGFKLGDSIITQAALGQGVTVTGGLNVTEDLSVTGSTQLNSTLTVEEVAIFNDEVECNNNVTVQGIFQADGNSVFEGQANFQSSVTDQTSSPGTAGQVLSSTGNNVQWVDAAQTVEITITDAQLRTIGTVPVEILPVVSGHTYQILGATAQAINGGGLQDDYGWSGQSGVISTRTSQFATLQKVEIPENELPSGGPGPNNDVYIATPISGTARAGSKVYVTVTDNIDPVVTPGESPSATWKITLTYRLIQL